MSNKPESTTVRNAAQRLRGAETLHTTIVSKLAAVRAAAPDLPDIETPTRDAEDAAAAHALGLANAGELDAARRALVEARTEAAATGGERAAVLAADLQEDRGVIKAATLAWLHADMAAPETAYLEAAQAAAQA